MKYMDIYNNNDNSLLNDDLLKKVSTIFSQISMPKSYMDFVSDTKYRNDNYYNAINNVKLYDTITSDGKDAFDAELYDRWRKNLINLSMDDVPDENKNEIILLKKIVDKYFPRVVEPKEDPAIEFFNKIPENTKIKAITQKLLRKYYWTTYETLQEGQSISSLETNHKHWQFVDSNKMKLNLSAPSYDVDHRLYLNVDKDYVFTMSKYFARKCEELNLPYHFKYGLDSRDDSIVIYSSNENLIKYTNALLQIQKEHPEIKDHIKQPPLLTSKVNDWIGYGVEPNINGTSYTSLRVDTLIHSIMSLNIIYIKALTNNDEIKNSFYNNLVCLMSDYSLNNFPSKQENKDILLKIRDNKEYREKFIKENIKSLDKQVELYKNSLKEGRPLFNEYLYKDGFNTNLSYPVFYYACNKTCEKFLINNKLNYNMRLKDILTEDLKKNRIDINNTAFNDDTKQIFEHLDSIGKKKR